MGEQLQYTYILVACLTVVQEIGRTVNEMSLTMVQTIRRTVNGISQAVTHPTWQHETP
jgi:hypothetical protein